MQFPQLDNTLLFFLIEFHNGADLTGLNDLSYTVVQTSQNSFTIKLECTFDFALELKIHPFFISGKPMPLNTNSSNIIIP